MTRKYSSTSVQTTLAADINSSITSMNVATGTATTLLGGVTLGSGNVDIFTVVLDPDTVNEEVIYITGVSGDTFNIVRGKGGTNPVAHTAGATVRHSLTSDDLNYYTQGISLPLITASGTTYTLNATDVFNLIRTTNSGATTVTIPANTFGVGDQINIQRAGAGTVQLVGAAGVTITSTGGATPSLRVQYSAATVICTSSNNFTVIGDLL